MADQDALDRAYLRYLDKTAALALERQARMERIRQEHQAKINEISHWWAEEIRPYAIAAGIQKGPRARRIA